MDAFVLICRSSFNAMARKGNKIFNANMAGFFRYSLAITGSDS